MKISKRGVGRIAVAAASAATLVVGLSACGPSSTPTGNGSKDIVIAFQSDVRYPDNITLGASALDRQMMGSTVYDPLFTADVNGDIQPALATAGTPNADATVWTLTLRKDVKFSDGKAFTSADVKANFDAFLDPANGSGYAGQLAAVSTIKVIDDYTIEFDLSSPDSQFTANMIDNMYIADLDARKSHGLLDPEEVPIGTGPYEWASRQSGVSVDFTPNPSYWRGTPTLDHVEFRTIADPQTAAIALQSGEVDAVVNNVSVQLLPALEKNPDLQVLHAEGSYFYQAYLNFEKARRGGYADGDKVHQGLAYLADTQDIIPPLIGAFGTPATQPIPSWMDGWSADVKPYPYDEQLGEQLLAEGGIPKGGTIKLLAKSDAQYLCDWATAVQSKLNKLGYNATLDCLESEVLPDSVTKYDWDMLFFTTSARASATAFYQQRWGIGLTLPQPDDTYTLRDQQLQDLIDQMKSAVDPAKYSALGAEVGKRIVETDAAVIPGYFQDVYVLANKRVHGLAASPLGFYPLLMGAVGTVTVDPK